MVSHYSSIGISTTDSEELVTIAQRATETARSVSTSHGAYLRWTCPSGAELWLQVNKQSEVIGLHPHFAGDSSMNIRIESVVRRPDQSVLDGAFRAWANETEKRSGDYPFVFDCANFRSIAGAAPPALGSVQLAAFALTADSYLTEEEFDAAQDPQMQYASQSFIPIGMFGDGRSPAESTAMFTGKVLAAETRRNSLTDGAFQWVKVDTYGGVYDVVLDSELLPALPPAGGLLSGTFWLSGVVGHAASQASLAKRLLWRIRNAR